MFEAIRNSLSYNAGLIDTIPVIVYCSAGFYFSLAVLLALSLFNRPVASRVFGLFSSPQPSTGKHLLPLDGLRGVAILGVASFHAWQWFGDFTVSMERSAPIIKYGNNGVLLFILLSGFLVHRSVKNMCISLDDLSRYAERRFLRIYPAYFANVIVLLAAGYIPSRPSIIQNFSAAAFLLNTVQYPIMIYSPAWSLYPEIIFYISLPLWTVCTRKYPLGYAAAGVFVFSLIDMPVVPHSVRLIRYFFAGIVASELFDRFTIKQGTAAILVASGIGLLYFDLSRYDICSAIAVRAFSLAGIKVVLDSAEYSSLTQMFALFALVLGSLKYAPVSAALSFGPLRFIGVVSYSIFLWHGVLLMYATNVIRKGHHYFADFGTLIGIYWPAYVFVGAVSYLLFERPFQKWRRI